MTKDKLRIVFMGTPPFAVASLRALVEGGYAVVGVVTQPDKAFGRHASTLHAPAVKQYASAVGLPVLQPDSLSDPAFLADLRRLRADLQVVVAFRLLPEAVWQLPPLGAFNLHASLLPQYRGAAPINWAIINGETETGLTTFFLDRSIDTGGILLCETLPILPDDNAGTLHDSLMQAGASLVLRTIDGLLTGSLTPTPQERLTSAAGVLHPAPKLNRDNCRINWLWPAADVHNLIRGLSPSPSAWTELHTPDGRCQTLKIQHSQLLPTQASANIGRSPKEGATLYGANGHLNVLLPDGLLRLHTLQPEGKKPMPAAAFLNGFHHPLHLCQLI